MKHIENESKTLGVRINSATENEKDSMSTTLTFEDSKALEVVNQIKKLKIENGTVSDAEIENLLKIELNIYLALIEDDLKRPDAFQKAHPKDEL